MPCLEINPIVTFDDSCPTVKTGSIDKMYLTRATIADILPNPFVLLDITGRIDNAEVDGDPAVGAAPIREFSVIGSTPERASSETLLPLGDSFAVRGEKTFPFEIFDLTAANLAWAVAVSAAGSIKKKAWFQGSDLFIGGYQGMNGRIKADIVYAADRTTPVKITGSFVTRESVNAIATTLLPVYA